jgi:hypothetical protein
VLNPESSSSSYKSKKLLSDFTKREKYVTHYMNLKTYLNLGMELKAIHRVLSFRQGTFLRDFVDHCTKLRAAANNIFEKNMWKLYVNAVFGKFIEQCRDRLQCVLVRSSEALEKWAGSPRYRACKIISEDNLTAVFLSSPSVKLNKAYAVGFTILERSKEFMYNQFYNEIRPRLGKCEVLFTDTDSFCICVETLKRTDNLEKLKDILDFSNYDSAHPSYCDVNKNALGFFKDEMKGAVIQEFVGLRSKTYALNVRNQTMQSRCKGVRKGYKKTIPFKAFKKCIQEISSVRVTQFNITSKNHKVETSRIDKLCFGSFDDKRHILSCAIHSVPYGSKYITSSSNSCMFCKKRPIQM